MEPQPASDALTTSTAGGEGRLEESSDFLPCRLDHDRLRRKTTSSTSGGRRSKTQGQPICQVFLLGHDAELIEGAVLDLPHSLLGHIEAARLWGEWPCESAGSSRSSWGRLAHSAPRRRGSAPGVPALLDSEPVAEDVAESVARDRLPRRRPAASTGESTRWRRWQVSSRGSSRTDRSPRANRRNLPATDRHRECPGHGIAWRGRRGVVACCRNLQKVLLDHGFGWKG